ncbi:hypothetical protein OAW23_05615 [Flavobacteriales bacterium]|nr:hypothetical protein [Flavobacteriales bacterium]
MTRRYTLFILITSLTYSMCSSSGNASAYLAAEHHQITCSEKGCKGTYSGPEFTNQSDVAHQFSNHMAREVGNQLKELYDLGTYSKVNLSEIIMTTDEMNHLDDVTYTLNIPFIRTDDSCAAYTAFDHRGGWGHRLKKEHVLNIFKSKSKLEWIELNTPEGLQEYWLQWKHQSKQAHCQ